MAPTLKSSHRTCLKVVEDSIREAQIEQSNINDIDFGTEIDMEKFVFVEYKDVAEPDTDPADHMHGNSVENGSTNPVSKMSTNSANVKSLAKAKAKKVMGKSTESLEIDNPQQTEEYNRLSRWMSTAMEQGTTPSCPLGSEASGEPHFEILDWETFSPTIWTCKHSDVFNGDIFCPIDVARISTETQSCQAMPIVDTPIACGDLDVRDMRKMVADLVGEDEEEVLVNLGDMDLGDQFREMLEGDDFNQDDYEFYEEVTDESDASEVTSKDEEVSEGSDGSFYVVKYPGTQVPK